MGTRDILSLERFCGRERYAIERTEVYVKTPEEDDARTLLNVEFHCGRAIEVTVPEAEGGGSAVPTVEVWIPLVSLALDKLVGTSVSVPCSQEDNEAGMWNRLYVHESEDLWDVVVTFLSVTATECRIALTAKTQDPNWYDGSKPPTDIQLEAAFSLDEVIASGTTLDDQQR